MATVGGEAPGAVSGLAAAAYQTVEVLGDLTVFSGRTLAWLVRRKPSRGTLIENFYAIGVRSVGVVLITGLFIGMVVGAQSYSEFHRIGLETQLGAIINVSVLRELGPVLAATMLAGRVGSAMAAELATMRITEQVDALSCLGVNPVYYLVVPRFLACVVLIPLLTVLADCTGILGGALICTHVYQVEAHHYWAHARDHTELWDVFTGLLKSTTFGAAIGLISCHRGFNSRAGAEGVGRAATEAFVLSFMAILVLDFFLALFTNSLYDWLWPSAGARML
jgi:phospholipid/cholesterol/gamma-HCH transport system permease protein